MELIFASANSGKLKEAAQILGGKIAIVSALEAGITEDIPETGNTFRENAFQKARYIYERTGKDCFADDSGLEVDALGGAPGVHTARYAGEDHNQQANMDKLLRELASRGAVDPSARTARFRTCVCLIRDGEPHYFEGVLEGRIGLQKRGQGGFGYDPIFIPEGMNCTNAELPEGGKNLISHRGKALRAMAAYLGNEA